MKHTSLAFLLVVACAMGMHHVASAQVVPVNHATLTPAHVMQSGTVPTIPMADTPAVAVTPTLSVAQVTATPDPIITNHVTIATLPADSAAIMHPGLAAAVSQTPVNPFSHITIATLPNDSAAIYHPGLAAIDHTQLMTSGINGIPNPDPGTGQGSSGASSGGSSGSGSQPLVFGSNGGGGGTTTGGYRAPQQTYVAPQAQAMQARPAYVAPGTATFHASTASKTVTREIIPMIPLDTTSADVSQNGNDYGASTYHIGTQVTLVEVLTAVAGLLMVLVAAKEYQMRKRAQQAHAQAYGVYA